MTLTTLWLTELVAVCKAEMVTEFTHGAVGTDSTAPLASDTTLGTETFRDAVDEVDTSQATSGIASLRVMTSEANGDALVEVGFLDAVAAGNLWTRNTFTVINKTADLQCFFDVQCTFNVTEDTSE